MIIKPRKNLRGEITVPGDKSISHRSVMLGALAKGTTWIDGFLMGGDCLSTINCFKKMGISIEILEGSRVKVLGKGLRGLSEPRELLYTGNSGTTTRLLLGILAGQNFPSRITGDETIEKRPMGRVTKPLSRMGAIITGRDGANLCPLTVSPSELKGISYEMPVASAQVKSAILLASLFAQGPTTVVEKEKSRDHTERMLHSFGGDISVEGNTIISKPVRELHAQSINVPGDISSAAYFITAGLITSGSDILIKNVGVNPTRAGILDVYKAMGGRIELLKLREEGKEPVADIRATSSALHGITIEGSMIPRLIDEIPVIAVAAAMAEGTTVIRNAEELKVKESNRIKTIVTELGKLGANISETDDGMIIEGGKSLRGAVTESHYDHRISMSMAVAGLAASGETVLEHSDIVNISFPDFFTTLSGL